MKFKVKDLINIAAFFVLYVIALFSIGMIGLIPWFMPLLPLILGIVAGPIYIMYTMKIRCKWTMVIFSFLHAIVFGLIGSGLYAIICVLVFGFLAELILQKGNYQSLRLARISFCVYTLYNLGLWLPFFVNRAESINKLKVQYGMNYARVFDKIVPPYSLIPLMILGIIGSYIGATLGIKIVKKHFSKDNV